MFLVIVFFLLISSTNAHTQGTISVDVFTFYKILHRFHTILLKFDDKFPFGGFQDEYKNLVDKVINARDFVVAEVPVTDRDSRENYHFGLNYDALKPDFPVYRLFINGNPKGIVYTGDRTSDDLRRFLLRYTNIWLGLPGTIEELDRIGREFFDATVDKNEHLQRVLLGRTQDYLKSLVNRTDIKNTEYYVKVMETVIKQGPAFLQTEKRRVQNLLKGKVTKEKKEELQRRENVLFSFKLINESITDQNKNTDANVGEQIQDTVKDAVVGERDL